MNDNASIICRSKVLNVVVTGDESYKGSHLENLPTSPSVEERNARLHQAAWQP